MFATKPRHVCLLGGTGFVGQHLTRLLMRQGHSVLIPSRRRERYRSLLVLPTVQVVQGDVYDPAFLRNVMRGADVVINLIGILNEAGRDGAGFKRAHVELATRMLDAVQEAGVRRVLQMSALNANARAPSHYLTSKGLAEDLVHQAADWGVKVTSFRPSVIFGPEDSFVNRFAALLRKAPGVLPLACPDARFQPIYVGDVATAFATAVNNPASAGGRYDLCGPRQYSLRELVTYIADVIDVRRKILPLSDGWSRRQAWLMGRLPGKLFTTDNYRSMRVDSVCHCPWPRVFGDRPRSLEEIAPTYLINEAPSSRLDDFRREAG